MAPYNGGAKYNDGVRLQVLTMVQCGFSVNHITNVTGMSKAAICALEKKAREPGYDPKISNRILLEYVTDKPRPGRPKKITTEKEAQIVEALEKADRYGREKAAWMWAWNHQISPTSMLRILHRYGFRSCKTTKKPGLNAIMRAARLELCRSHTHWTLEDWKNIIWTDETSVILGSRRDVRRRIWRRPNEQLVAACIRRRWSGYSEFMFWGSFTYDLKGPMHIWKKETSAEKKQADADLAARNKALEPVAKRLWMQKVKADRLKYIQEHNGRVPGGRAPVWEWDARHGKLTRNSKGGIDWYRYAKYIIIPKLVPFAKRCMLLRPGTIVQEDGAGSHALKHQATLYSTENINRRLWPGNSPDLNMIEPAWI